MPLLTLLSAITLIADTSSGGLIVRLGTDTLSAERWTRSATRMEGDYVQRMPSASQWHYVLTLSTTGLPRTLELTPVRSTSAPSARAIRRVGIIWEGDSLTLVVLRDTLIRRRRAAVNGMPIFPDSYAFFEIWLSWLRQSGKDSAQVGVIGPIGGPSGNIPVMLRGRDSAQAMVFGSPIRIRTDAEGRLWGLDATASTIKHVAERVPSLDLDKIYASFARHDSTSGPTGVFISTRDTARAQVGAAQLWIDYGRPAKRGRNVFAKGVLGDTLWRTGANAATQFRTDRELQIGDRRLPAGLYTLYSQIGASGAELVINGQTGQWGTEYHPDRDVMRVPLSVKRTPGRSTELFTITIIPGATSGTGAITFTWDDTEWQLPIVVL